LPLTFDTNIHFIASTLIATVGLKKAAISTDWSRAHINFYYFVQVTCSKQSYDGLQEVIQLSKFILTLTSPTVIQANEYEEVVSVNF
jgi:hypothetical protein